MKKANAAAVTGRVQAMINAGELTFMGPCLVYHSRSGAWNVGKTDDLQAVWNRICAHRSRDNR